MSGSGLVKGGIKKIVDRLGSRITGVAKTTSMAQATEKVGKVLSSVEHEAWISQKAAKVLDSAGTVWSKISNEAEHMGRTIIPKRFDIFAGTEKFHVHPNATKHMGEIFAKKQHTHLTPMHNQVVLGSFHNALEEVAKMGA